ncbi:hypothetical protein [Aureibaculum luteum]|uniref:hypothetical protein n=1 Tax=Aureibaculum luteum TaxID=1548456 RepID=UPI000E51D7DB|nr:hypothetical protein [Aureibaculum luteum]
MENCQKGKLYELLIRKAFKCETGGRHGAKASLFEKIIFNELNGNENINNDRMPPAFRFNKVKGYVGSALSKLARTKKYLHSEHEFPPIKQKLRSAETTDDLLVIIKLSLKKINECEDVLRDRNNKKGKSSA